MENNEESSILPNEIIDIITEIAQEEGSEALNKEQTVVQEKEITSTEELSCVKNDDVKEDATSQNNMESELDGQPDSQEVICIDDDSKLENIEDKEVEKIMVKDTKEESPIQQQIPLLVNGDGGEEAEMEVETIEISDKEVAEETKATSPVKEDTDETELQSKKYDLKIAKVELENIIAKVDTVFKETENKKIENKEAKKKNLLGLIKKIKPNSTTLIGKTSETINVSNNGSSAKKRKTSPPTFYSKTHNGILQRQTIASATVQTQQVLGKTVVRSKSNDRPKLKPGSPITIPDSPTDDIDEAENNMDLDSKANEMYSDNVFGHMLDFMYKGLMARAMNQTIPNPQGGSDDPSLEMPDNMKSGVQVLVDCMQKGSESLKQILTQEVDTILECRRCKGLFRSIPNLVKHKKMFCKASGTMTNFFNKQTNSSADENRSLNNLLNILNPQDNAEDVVVDLKPISSNSNAMYQKITKPATAPTISKIVFSKPSNNTTSYQTFTSYTSKPSHANITTKSTPQYIILNQGKGPISRGQIKTTSATATFTNHQPSPNVMITTSGRIGALTNSLNSMSNEANKNKSKPTTGAIVKHISHINNKNTNSDVSDDFDDNSKKPKCPICNKEMAERKNVKRHLVHVHMLSVEEAWKLMHKTMPLHTSTAKHRSVSDMKKSTDQMRKMCVEIMEIGPHREVKVLPKTYMYPDAYCPVCAKAMSSRNNVRRHMLESHDFLIQGDKKYYQLKLLLTKSNGVLDGTNRSMRQFYGTSSNMDIETIKAQLEAIEAYKRNEMMESQVSATMVSSVSKIKELEKKAGIEEIEDDEHSKPELTKSEAKKLIDAALCKCLSCNEEFCRRQTLRNHMIQTHQWSVPLFNGVYDDAYNKKSEDEDSESEEEGEFTSKAKNENSASKALQNLSKLATKGGDNSAKKVVILHKIVTAPGVVSTTTPTVVTSKVGGNSAGGSVIPPGGIYVMKTGVQIIPQKTTTTVISEIGTKRKLSDNADNQPVLKKEKLFDIKNNLCCLCNQEFNSTSLLKRHMIEIHSCTMEQVLGASRDTKHVDPEVQKYGESMGYDIENAKCLVCQKYFFVRHALKKHLNKAHAYKYENLQGLDSEPEESDSDENSKNDKKPYGFQLRTVVRKETNVNEQSSENNSSSDKTNGVLLSIKKGMFSEVSSLERMMTEKAAQDALKVFPVNHINSEQLKCTKCKHKYSKVWDLKVHILKHVGFGIYACKFCDGEEVKCAYRLEVIMDHITNDHPHVSRKAATTSAKSAKINNRAIWRAYGLPLRR